VANRAKLMTMFLMEGILGGSWSGNRSDGLGVRSCFCGEDRK
jgi:hypothetical protein